jgi:folate-binding protein YgfZ
VPQQGARPPYCRSRGAPAVRHTGVVVTTEVDQVHVFERFDCGVVAVEGPDALSYLQSLVSQDLDPLADGESTRSLLLQPQGKLTAVFSLLRISNEAAVLATDEGFGAPLAEALQRFRIRVKAEIVDRSDIWGVLSVRSAGPIVVPARENTFAIPADWPTQHGVDIVGPFDALRQVRDELVGSGAVLGDFDTYERMRIEAGVPRQGVDVDERTIPQEAFLEHSTVSFTKGCFLGQELVCRIDTRGHVNRYLRRLELDVVPTPGAEIVLDERTVGTITSVAPTASGAVALATVRREVEPPADVMVRWLDHEAKARVTSV